METLKSWFKNFQLATMSGIAIFVIVTVMSMYAAELYKWNALIHNKLITIEVYERLVTSLNEKTFQFVFTILAFFFGKDLGRKEEEKNKLNIVKPDKKENENAA